MKYNVDEELSARERREYNSLDSDMRRAKYRALRLRGEAHSFAMLIASKTAPQGRVKWSTTPTRSWHR